MRVGSFVESRVEKVPEARHFPRSGSADLGRRLEGEPVSITHSNSGPPPKRTLTSTYPAGRAPLLIVTSGGSGDSVAGSGAWVGRRSEGSAREALHAGNSNIPMRSVRLRWRTERLHECGITRLRARVPRRSLRKQLSDQLVVFVEVSSPGQLPI